MREFQKELYETPQRCSAKWVLKTEAFNAGLRNYGAPKQRGLVGNSREEVVRVINLMKIVRAINFCDELEGPRKKIVREH